MSRSRFTEALAIVGLAGTLAACSGDAPEAPPRAAVAPAAPIARSSAPAGQTGALPRLVFFMNPAGAPCITQDRILREMGGELAGRAELVYYSTAEPGDLPRFAQYGIRALPLLVVTDAAGRELRRATPGIQGPDQIRRLLAL